MAWLNETTPDDIAFFLVRLDAYRIGRSDPAPLFTVIVGPSAEAKAFGQRKKELAERHVLRLKFWEGLLAKARESGLLLHAQRAPTKDAWISAGAGRAGLTFNYVVWMEEKAAAELVISTGDRDDDEKDSCRIRHTIEEGGLTLGEDQWPKIQDAMIDAMRRLVTALKPHLLLQIPPDVMKPVTSWTTSR